MKSHAELEAHQADVDAQVKRAGSAPMQPDEIQLANLIMRELGPCFMCGCHLSNFRALNLARAVKASLG